MDRVRAYQLTEAYKKLCSSAASGWDSSSRDLQGLVGQGDEAAVERLKAKAYQSRDKDEYLAHNGHSPYVQMSNTTFESILGF